VGASTMLVEGRFVPPALPLRRGPAPGPLVLLPEVASNVRVLPTGDRMIDGAEPVDPHPLTGPGRPVVDGGSGVLFIRPKGQPRSERQGGEGHGGESAISKQLGQCTDARGKTDDVQDNLDGWCTSCADRAAERGRRSKPSAESWTRIFFDAILRCSNSTDGELA
jgi:hypothetical protein